jgi:trk system potassium uptake protein TrkA
MQFDVPRTIARVNNPKNEELFKRLGIDVTVSSTNIILSIIEQEIPERGLRHLLMLKHAQLAIVEAMIEDHSKVAGKTLSEIDFPEDTVISVVLRDGTMTIPHGDTVLEPKDEIIAIVKRESETALRDMLAAS